jgi:hypothetical protein
MIYNYIKKQKDKGDEFMDYEEFLIKFRNISQDRLNEIANEVVGYFVTDRDDIIRCSENKGISMDEMTIEEVLDYYREELADKVLEQIDSEFDLFPANEKFPSVDELPRDLSNIIKELADSAVPTKNIEKQFDEILSELRESEEDKHIMKDPWRGTGMSQKDFI